MNNVRILSSYKIAIIKPNGLDIELRRFSREFNFVTTPEIYCFDDFFFDSISGYNKLMLSREFYQRFAAYSYMLVCQSDAYIFSDKLEEWVAKKYDYIGSPWPEIEAEKFVKTLLQGRLRLLKLMQGFNKLLFRKKDYAIGNGGLSLRNIQKSLIVLKYFGFLSAKWNENEDLFWSIITPLIFPFFKVPNLQDAIGFAIEKEPEFFFNLNNKQLPFGCHGWQKYQPDFWHKIYRILQAQLIVYAH